MKVLATDSWDRRSTPGSGFLVTIIILAMMTIARRPQPVDRLCRGVDRIILLHIETL